MYMGSSLYVYSLVLLIVVGFLNLILFHSFLSVCVCARVCFFFLSV